jgi:hypothetical protein
VHPRENLSKPAELGRKRTAVRGRPIGQIRGYRPTLLNCRFDAAAASRFPFCVVGTQGFYIDTTPDEREQQDLVTAQLAVIAENRAVIEQAKGVLMAAYGINAVRAFEILVWRSQETNIKLRELALRFMAAISASHLSPESRRTVDHTLLTLR